MSNKTFKISKIETGLRLDKFLTEKLSEYSRSHIQKLIKNEEITVNQKIVPAHYFLKEGDEILVTYNVKLETQEKKEDIMNQNPPPRIIFDNANFIIVEKPSGLLVHQTAKLETHTLVGWLLWKYPELQNVGEQNYRAGIIHRLDKDVSGIMVIAKTQEMYHHLKEQFKKRTIKKEYTAVVYGHMPEYQGKIEIPIGRSPEGKFVAHPRREQKKLQDTDKHAITLYRVLERKKNYDILSVNILTGRTHQIRAHMQYLGHPIIGDTEYSTKKPFLKFFSKKIKVVPVPRIMLHSSKIGFYNLNNEWVEFTSSLPTEFKNFLF